MNYLYALDHGPDMTHPLRETDLRVRLRMALRAQPNVPVGARRADTFRKSL